MSDKENIPESALTTTSGMSNWLLKRVSDWNVFGSQTSFKAKILTTPVPLQGGAANATGGGGDAATPIGTYVCMVRILNRRMAHHKFLEDPCELADATDPAYISKLLSLHTRMSIPPGSTGGAPMPAVNDIVDIILEPGESCNNPYDLQIGKFSKMRYQQNPASGPPQRCTSLDDAFDSASSMLGGAYGGGYGGEAGTLGSWDNSDGLMSIVPKSSVLVSTAQTNFLAALRQSITESEIPQVVVTSAIRTARQQASTTVSKRALGKFASLYGQKDLVKEVMAVPNTMAAVTAVYESQMQRGRFISKHMRGQGLDFRSKTLTSTQKNLLIAKCKQLGASAFLEVPGTSNEHIHVGVPDSFADYQPAGTMADASSTQQTDDAPGTHPEAGEDGDPT